MIFHPYRRRSDWEKRIKAAIIKVDILEGPDGYYAEINGEKLKDTSGGIRWFTRRCDASRVASRLVPDREFFSVRHWYAE